MLHRYDNLFYKLFRKTNPHTSLLLFEDKHLEYFLTSPWLSHCCTSASLSDVEMDYCDCPHSGERINYHGTVGSAREEDKWRNNDVVVVFSV